MLLLKVHQIKDEKYIKKIIDDFFYDHGKKNNSFYITLRI